MTVITSYPCLLLVSFAWMAEKEVVGFSLPQSPQRRIAFTTHHYSILPLTTKRILQPFGISMSSDSNTDDAFDFENDAELLETVDLAQFQKLCDQLNISRNGSKEELLARLRAHANQQAELEDRRRADLKARVEQGVNDDERERHEIVGGSGYSLEDISQEDDQGYFYFELPATNGLDTYLNSETKNSKAAKNSNSTRQESSTTGAAITTTSPLKKQKQAIYRTQSDVLAPPPPPPETATVDDDGNRVVTVYSTTDHNDLTGVAAAQPGQAALSGTDPMAAASSLGTTVQPWDMEGTATTKSATSHELEKAKEKVIELVQVLLAMSGAPAFAHYDMPDELDYSSANGNENALEDMVASSVKEYRSNLNVPASSNPNNRAFVGFDPSKVPTHILTEASASLRANRGKVLQEVLREFELHAVGQDGMHGDNAEDGGGHFREVSKVRAFLEGYRRAQVRKAARSTTTFLLDKLVSEGIEGLDMTLSTMSRSSDDSASEFDAYELNDSLIDYLNDVIREQETRVDQQFGSSSSSRHSHSSGQISPSNAIEIDQDRISGLWNLTRGDDGEVIESIDPGDIKIKQVLQEEYEKSEREENFLAKPKIPDAAPEKLLLLLTLLRERIKTEGAFGNDERSRNLRVLAYCLQCNSMADREELILKDMGGFIDRLDSFLELVSSSIEYAESTSYQLKPSKGMPLNVKLLKSIRDMAENLRETQAWKASGLKP